MIGALVTNYKGKRLELAGLTDEERQFATTNMAEYACAHAGEDMPASFQGKHFQTGSKVTFVFRELTDEGIPREARYLRKRDDE
jgi:hypothetical protein